MECYEAESLLIDYLDAQLHPSDKKPLEKHLESCPLCRQALEEYRQLFAAIEKDATTEVTVNLEEQLISVPSLSISEQFDINPYKKTCMINGYDDIDFLLSIKNSIEQFENASAQ